MDHSAESSMELLTPERGPQQLTIPPPISPSTLSVDTHLPWMPRESSVSPNVSTPSSSRRTIYSDRFIPSRVSSNFALFDVSPLPNGDKEERSSAYTSLLRSVMFGDVDSSGFSPVTPEKVNDGSPNRNIFRFKTEIQRSLFSPTREDNALRGIVPSQPKAPRKVQRSPFKVLDAPSLQDDFYLNLVDWSSHNVIAVGLS